MGLQAPRGFVDSNSVGSLTVRDPRAHGLPYTALLPEDAGAREEHTAIEAPPPAPPPGRLAAGPSLLCNDESTRARMLDMESHLRPARAALFAVLAGTLLALGPWIGWWPLAPLAGALAGFLIADRMTAKTRRPEYCFMAAWGFAQLMIGMSVVFTGGPRSLFLAWLAIPAATLPARFNARGVVAGVAWTAAIMVAVTVGVDATPIAQSPQRLLVPLTLLAGVTLLTTGLMRSDIKHRAAAAVDPLTGLFNRHALELRAVEMIAQAKASGAPMAAVIGDLDHFKEVNDRHGHLIGDRVLREVANTLRTTLRTFDYIYRYGGEEFVVLLPGNDEAGALATAERLRLAITCSCPAGFDMTMSFGVGVSDAADTALDELLTAADRALYCAKAEGRDRVCLGRASDAISVSAPKASLAARASRLQDGAHDVAQPTPAGAFAAARAMYLRGQRVDMQVLAAQLGVSGATLQKWCGERDELLGEVLASLCEGLIRHAKAEHRATSGAPRFLAIYRQFAHALVHAQSLQIFLQQEPHSALEILTSANGHVHPRTVRTVQNLLREEQEARAFEPRADLPSLAYAIVRMTEGFLYHDTTLATEPQIDRAVRVVALLLG